MKEKEINKKDIIDMNTSKKLYVSDIPLETEKEDIENFFKDFVVDSIEIYSK